MSIGPADGSSDKEPPVKLRTLAATLVVGAFLAVTSPAIAETTLPPVTVPPLPIPVPPVTVPPLPVPLPPLPLPTPDPTPTNPGAPSLPPGLPSLPGAGGGGLPIPDGSVPSVPGLGGVGGPAPGAGSIPGAGDPLAALGALADTGPGVLPIGPGLPSDLASIGALQDALDLAVDTVTNVVCQVLTVVATNLAPATAAVDTAVDLVPVPPVGTSLGGAVGFSVDLQALSELPSSTLLTLSANLPGLLTVKLALPACPEGTPATPAGQDPANAELIPPSNIARVLRISGTPVSVTRPAPALPSSPAMTG
jgi:hypothetical protein